MGTVFVITWLVMFGLVGSRSDLMMTGMIAVIALCSLWPGLTMRPPSQNLCTRCYICPTKRRNSIWDSGLSGKFKTEILQLAIIATTFPSLAWRLRFYTFARNIQWQEITNTCCHLFHHSRTISPWLQAILANTISVFRQKSFWEGARRSIVMELSWWKRFERRDCSRGVGMSGWPDQLVLRPAWEPRLSRFITTRWNELQF